MKVESYYHHLFTLGKLERYACESAFEAYFASSLFIQLSSRSRNEKVDIQNKRDAAITHDGGT